MAVREVVGVDDEETQGEVVDGGEEQEVQPASTLPTPYMPSQSERDDHNLSHAQYRSWCEHCVKGRGLEAAHRSSGEHYDRGVAAICFGT